MSLRTMSRFAWIIVVATVGCRTAVEPHTDQPSNTDTDDGFFAIPTCTPHPSDTPHPSPPLCDPTPVAIDIDGHPNYTVGCITADLCYGSIEWATAESTDLYDVVELNKNQRSPMECCSQDGAAYRYVTFGDDWSILTLYYDDQDVLQAIHQLFNTGPPTYCLNPDGESLTWVNSIWRGKILDRCF